MKVFLCFLAVLVAGVVESSTLPRLAAQPKIDMTKMINPEILKNLDQLQHFEANFNAKNARKQIEDINDFVDMVIAEVRNFLVIYGFDPMNLPNIDETIDIAGTDIHLQLQDGVVFNASSIYRDGDVSLYYENRKLVIEVPMFFKLFKMNYAYNIEVGNDTTLLKGELDGEVVIVDVNYAIELDFIKLEISLKSFNISNMGAINVKFDGTMLNWILQGITDYVTEHLNTEIILVVEEICRFTLTTIFDIINKILESITP